MKLPLSLIINATKDLIKWQPIRKSAFNRCYLRPMFWQPDAPFYEDSCVIIAADTKEIKTKFPKNTLLIAESDVPLFPTMKSSCYGQLIKGASLHFVSNRLHKLFDFYEEWESQLKTLVTEQNAINKMLQISRNVLKNPMIIMNSQYTIYYTTDSFDSLAQSGAPPIDEHGHIPETLVNFFKNDENYLAAAEYQEPFYYVGEELPRQVLCQNLFFQGVFAARISVDSYEHEFHDWDPFLLNILTAYLQIVYLNELPLMQDSSNFAQVLNSLLHNEPIGSSEVLQMLSFKKWDNHDFYRICILLPSQQDISNNTLNFYCYRLTTEFSNCMAIVDHEHLVVLFNLKKSASFSDHLNQRLTLFIRESNFRIGFSNYFKGLDFLSEFYQQASIALAYGEKYNPTIWRHTFNEYAMDYILSKCSDDISPQHLCAQELQILKSYDSSNNTELYNTLKVYLTTNQSPVASAKELFIQRGTLNYRLKRIQQLTQIDFNNQKRLLYVLFSYALLD